MEKICGGFCYAEIEVRVLPSRPKHPCAYGNCPNLTDKRYCPEHEKLMNQKYEKYGRNPNAKRRYGRAWKRIRDKYAKPLSEGGTHDRSNLIALCKSCHSSIHARRGDRWKKNCEYSYRGQGR